MGRRRKEMASQRLPGWRLRTWPVVAALVGLAGWVSWQAFAADGVFTNPSAQGPQRADALMVVLAVITLLVALSSVAVDRRSLEHPAPATVAADRDEVLVPRLVDLLAGSPRLGDDPALAVEALRVHRSIPLPPDAPAGLDPQLPGSNVTKLPDSRNSCRAPESAAGSW